MNGLKQWVVTLAAVAAVLAVASLLHAGQIWNIKGEFATSFVNDKPAQFWGTMVFPVDDTVEVGRVTLNIAGEPLLREADFVMSINLPADEMQPYDMRIFKGTYNADPWTMVAVDYDGEAGASLDPTALDGGGGWDAWMVSFKDYTLGSIDYMGTTPQVNEPAAMALAAIGFVMVFGMARDYNRRR